MNLNCGCNEERDTVDRLAQSPLLIKIVRRSCTGDHACRKIPISPLYYVYYMGFKIFVAIQRKPFLYINYHWV